VIPFCSALIRVFARLVDPGMGDRTSRKGPALIGVWVGLLYRASLIRTHVPITAIQSTRCAKADRRACFMRASSGRRCRRRI
jgi:hypothetical protein